jgi:D-lactate dehydrogenase (cytochrome)
VRRIKVVFSDSTFMTLSRGEYIAEGRRMSFPAGRNFFCFDIPSYDSKEDVGPRISENMDLMDLFIGSEGIFCIITEADIYLSDRPESVETVECGKLLNGRIGEIHGQRSVEELKKVKEILDAAYILNVGNLL